MVLVSTIVLSIKRVSLRRDTRELAVVEAAVSADLYFAANMHAQRIREFERVEERVSYNCRSFVCRFGFEKSENYLFRIRIFFLKH